MHLTPQQLNTATFIGIDAHPDSHTAVAINRFKEVKASLTFPNTLPGIQTCLHWMRTVEQENDQVILGVEGGSTARTALLLALVNDYTHLFEVNPLYTKHKRSFGTKGDKTDVTDAKLIASVLTTELEELPRITPEQLASSLLCLKKMVWYYEEMSTQGARLKNHLHKLLRESNLTKDREGKQVIAMIIRSRKKELRTAEKTKATIAKAFTRLLPAQGKNLTSIRGIGIITAARLVAHTSGIERFPNRNAYVRYAGIAPLEKSSGNTKRFVNTTRGNRKLNSVIYYAVMDRLVHCPEVKQCYQEKIATGKTKQEAILYLMRKTAILIYSMLKSGQEYRG